MPSRRGRDVPSSHKKRIWCDDRKKKERKNAPPSNFTNYIFFSISCLLAISKRFELPELLQSACKIVIATANNVQTTLASLLRRLTDKRLFVFGARRYNCEGVPCFFDILVCTMSEIQSQSGIMADHALVRWATRDPGPERITLWARIRRSVHSRKTPGAFYYGENTEMLAG